MVHTIRLKQQRVTFTACGFFPLDYNLLYSVNLKQYTTTTELRRLLFLFLDGRWNYCVLSDFSTVQNDGKQSLLIIRNDSFEKCLSELLKVIFIPDRRDLAQHTLIHTGERSHVCKVCNKAFNRSSNLRVHERIHSGYRPHVCPVCQRAFIQKHVLVTHMKTHPKSE